MALFGVLSQRLVYTVVRPLIRQIETTVLTLVSDGGQPSDSGF